MEQSDWFELANKRFKEVVFYIWGAYHEASPGMCHDVFLVPKDATKDWVIDDKATSLLHLKDLASRLYLDISAAANLETFLRSITDKGLFGVRHLSVPSLSGIPDCELLVLTNARHTDFIELPDAPSFLRALDRTVQNRLIAPVWESGPGSWANITSRGDMLRVASDLFLYNLTARLLGEGEAGLHQCFDDVSQIAYEGSPTNGTICIAPSQSLKVQVKLKDPVAIKDSRSIRKVLVAAGNCPVVGDADKMVGLGTAEGCLRVQFFGAQHWEVAIGLDQLTPTPIYQVRNGTPRAIGTPMTQDELIDAIRPIFGDLPLKAIAEIHKAIITVSKAKIGCIIAIDDHAHVEANRLRQQAFSIEPRHIEPELLRDLASIDGAVIMDTSGRCHAFGAILDGLSQHGLGDRSRGARYNSALRYVNRPGALTAAIVVSDDGYVDFLVEKKREQGKA